MIEKILLDYLTEYLEVPVYMEVPETAPDEFVVIEKEGSGMSNHVKSALMAFQSYSTSMQKAAELNELVKELLDESIILDEICAAKLNSDYNFTDISTKRYRYQAVYDFIHY